MNLSIKYRPKEFNEVLSQSSIIKILEKQLETKQYSNCYLLTGRSGCGKTTLARIFANKINGGKSLPIEIDAASNNGVDNVRAIIEEASKRSVDSEYKIFIVDETHMITTAGWNAFLKCLEECPKYCIFIFCTTNPEKIPLTIQGRLMRFNLSKVNTQLIKERLEYICKQEGFTNYNETIDYISKVCDGGVRDAISMLDKCSQLSKDLNINSALECLGDYSYDTFFNLTNALYDNKEDVVLSIINKSYDEGKDLKQFVNQYLSFVLDITKYCLFKDIDATSIPSYMEKNLKYSIGFDNPINYYNWLVNKILSLKILVKNDLNIKSTIEASLIAICQGK